MGKMNLAVNRLLQRKSIYADLMNGTIFHGAQHITKEDLEWIPEESGIFYRDSKGKLHALERRGDIRMRTDTETFSLILATESENKVHYGMPVKTMLYEALEYTRQIQDLEKTHRKNGKTGSRDEFLSGIRKDDRLIPVITTVLYTGNKKDWDGPKSLWDMFQLPDNVKSQTFRKYLSDYHIHLIDVNDINNPELFQTALKQIFFMLRYREDKKNLYRYIQDNKSEIQKMDDVERMAVFELLGEQKRVGQLLMESSIEKETEVPNMCKAIDDLILDGEQRGGEHAHLTDLKNLIKNLNLTADQAMDALSIPTEVRPKYQRVL